MTYLNRLILEATQAAQSRGHSIALVDWTVEGTRAYAECSCGAFVQADAHPAPNGIDIGGDAVAVTHKEETR